MTELRNVEADLSRFRARVFVAGLVVVLSFLLLTGRLVYLQVVRHDDLSEQAESNRTAVVPIVPNRGLILDRTGAILATNYSAYTLEITPSKIRGPLDAALEELNNVVEITPRDRRRFKKLMDESKSFESLPIRTRLTDEEVAKFAAQRYRFAGVEIKARLFRSYPFGELASHVIGYIGRVNQTEKQNMEDWPDEDQANYRGTDYIGKLGIEPPTLEPRATDYVPQMLGIIAMLEAKDMAYQASNGDMNFAVRKFAGYGKLSGKSLDELRAALHQSQHTDPLLPELAQQLGASAARALASNTSKLLAFIGTPWRTGAIVTFSSLNCPVSPGYWSGD